MRLLPYILVIIGIVTLVQYFNSGGRLGEIKKLQKEGVEVMGLLDEDYTTLQKGSTILNYQTTYKFNVDGVEYKGERTTYTEPVNPIVKIVYLKDDPNVNGYDLEVEKQEIKDNGSSTTNLLLSIGALLVGLVWSGMRLFGGKSQAA